MDTREKLVATAASLFQKRRGQSYWFGADFNGQWYTQRAHFIIIFQTVKRN